MQNKIPPPLILLFCIGMTWLTSAGSSVGGAVKSWSAAYLILGLGIAGGAILQFARARTTVNPLKPQAASTLVQSGIFAYTRNPMYLGMALVLFSFVLLRGETAGLLWLIFFIAYIQVFQIIPEERAISAKFGKDFEDYRKRVRAWL